MGFLDTFAAALPREIRLDDLKILVSSEIWQETPELAAIQSLRRCGKFDTRDYLERYPDVTIEDLDPVHHFVMRGIAEKRYFKCVPDTPPGHSKVKLAYQYYKEGNYEKALALYEELAAQMGYKNFSANISICKKKIKNDDRKKNISVIIPAYNAENTIARALDSILNQTLPGVEIIIFDDCSSDKTVDVIKSYQNHTDIILLESEENVGQGKGRNKALQHARGQFVTFLDADDYYLDKGYLDYLWSQAIAENADVVVTPYVRKRGNKLHYDTLQTGLLNGAEAAQKFLSREFGTHAPGGKLFRTYIAQNCAFVEYGYSQDVLFCFRALRMAQRVCVSKRYGYVYENDNISCWRPNNFTDYHFFSSLRLMAEVWAECLILSKNGQKTSFNDFKRLWRKEHVPRINSYLLNYGDKPWSRTITSSFDGMRAFMLQFIVPDSIYPAFYNTQKFTNTNIISKITKNALDYAINKVKIINSMLDEEVNCLPKSGNKDIIVIYVAHLAFGGLERVAVQLGVALYKDYDIIYLLDNPEKIQYNYSGKIKKANLFDPVVRMILDKAVFIFDFKYKIKNKEYPICLYCLDKYAHKYIATVHNTKTCDDYIEKVKYYLGDRTLSALYATLCVSNAVKSELIRQYSAEGKIEVIHNPIDFSAIDAIEPCQNILDPFILFAGRLNATQHKGLDILLQAWLALSDKGNCHLILAGAGKLEESIQNMLDFHGASAQIKVLGFRDDIYALMKKALFLVAPSRWEGFSMTLVESLACGTPVLTTKVGGAPEVVIDGVNGFFIHTEDIKDTLRGIEYMLDHAENMKASCRSSVSHLDLPRYRRKMLHFLQSVNC